MYSNQKHSINLTIDCLKAIELVRNKAPIHANITAFVGAC